MTKKEKENKRKGIIAAIVSHALFLVFALLFLSWKAPGPPWPFPENGFVAIDIQSEESGNINSESEEAQSSSAAAAQNEEQVEETALQQDEVIEEENPIEQVEQNETAQEGQEEGSREAENTEEVVNETETEVESEVETEVETEVEGTLTGEGETGNNETGEGENEEGEAEEDPAGTLNDANTTGGGGEGDPDWKIDGWKRKTNPKYQLPSNCDMEIGFSVNKFGKIVSARVIKHNCIASDSDLQNVLDDLKRNVTWEPESTSSRVSGLTNGSVKMFYRGK